MRNKESAQGEGRSERKGRERKKETKKCQRVKALGRGERRREGEGKKEIARESTTKKPKPHRESKAREGERDLASVRKDAALFYLRDDMSNSCMHVFPHKPLTHSSRQETEKEKDDNALAS